MACCRISLKKMIYVGQCVLKPNRICNYDDCEKNCNFNFKNAKKAIFCLTHRMNGMIDVKNKRCKETGCKTQPTFNIKGEKCGLYCLKHKTDGMIDVKSSTCIEPECETRPTFNIKGEKQAIYCANHKKDGMIDVKNQRCKNDECKTRPAFNIKGEKQAIYCANHKKNGMIDVRNRSCKNEWCNTLAFVIKYEGYCYHCFVHMFPDKPNTRNYKSKERAVVEFVKTNFPRYDWLADKIIPNACSRRRPDMFIDLGYQCIIIEIDENQHQLYDSTCENRRLMELSQDINHRPLVFIRFNPDDYKNNGKNITSCWANSKTGVACVKKSKQKEWEMRLTVLNKTIEKWSNPDMKCSKTIEIEHLFYDS